MKYLYSLMVVLTLESATFGQQVTINIDKCTRIQALREIERQSGYEFVYAVSCLENLPMFHFSVTKVGVEEAVKKCLVGTKVKYLIHRDRKVIVIQCSAYHQPSGKN